MPGSLRSPPTVQRRARLRSHWRRTVRRYARQADADRNGSCRATSGAYDSRARAGEKAT